MPFCTNCGEQIADEAKFCSNCGTAVEKVNLGNQDQRRQRFEGEIRKCPNCGEILSSFDIKCHVCGHELRNVNVSTGIQAFSDQIAQIEAGRSGRRVGETEKSIATAIRNFPVPNTKEDVFEFMLLASSNIDASLYSTSISQRTSAEYHARKTLNDAWLAKAEQVYHKAKLSFRNDSDFFKIQEMYNQKISSINTEKRRGTITGMGNGVVSFINKFHTKAAPFLGSFAIFALCIAYFVGLRLSHGAKEKQLESIVVEIQDCIVRQDYDSALIKAQGLYMDDNYSSESKKRWDSVRKELIAVIEAKINEQVYLTKISPPLSSDQCEDLDYESVVRQFSDAGFTNVETLKKEDLITGWITRDGKVAEVTINGRTSFSAEDFFDADAKVVVKYHTFAEDKKTR